MNTLKHCRGRDEFSEGVIVVEAVSQDVSIRCAVRSVIHEKLSRVFASKPSS